MEMMIKWDEMGGVDRGKGEWGKHQAGISFGYFHAIG